MLSTWICNSKHLNNNLSNHKHMEELIKTLDQAIGELYLIKTNINTNTETK